MRSGRNLFIINLLNMENETEKRKKRPRKKTCTHCGRKLWLRDFYKLKSGYRYSLCRECTKLYKREQYRRHHKVTDGIIFHEKTGRIVEHQGLSVRIFWSENMLSLLRRYYPNTKNNEIAEMLGVSPRTVTRKARELHLKKSPDFIAAMSREHLLLANARSKELGYPGGFTKGMKFRGNQYTGRVRVE